jgi:hypothetical protein
MTERQRDEHGRFVHVEQVEPDPDDTLIIDAEIIEEEDEQAGELVVFGHVDRYPMMRSVVEQIFRDYDRSRPVLARSMDAFEQVEKARAVFESGNIYPELAKPIAEDTTIRFNLAAARG